MKVVFAKHPDSSVNYIFQVPEDKTLQSGNVVIADTKNGEKIVICQCDSFEIPENALSAIMEKMNSNLVAPKSIVGIYHKESWDLK